MNAGLYVVGTPIGNLQDITLRALETLREVGLILAEDTRQTRKLLDRHGLTTRMMSYHKFNEAARVDEILARLREGEAIALVSDSGMPAVSDPGARIVAACRREGLPVTVLPGPSAVTAAIALSGFHGRGFVFGGFLPRKPGPRRRELKALDRAGLPIVLFESPFRLLALLEAIGTELGPRSVCVTREVTKHFEECVRGTPAEVRASFANRSIKGEITLVIEAGEGRTDEEDPEEADDPPDASGDEAGQPVG